MDGLPAELRALGEQLPPAVRLATETMVMARLQLSRQMGAGFNGRRDYYSVLGYDETITAQQYRLLYRRGGIAARAVNAVPKAVWRGDGEIVEDKNVEVETDFETAFFEMNDRLKIWPTMQRTHILATLTSFSVLLLGAPGDFDKPLPRARNPKDLYYLQPYGGAVVDDAERSQRAASSASIGADVVVATYDEDVHSPRFGKPLTYNLRRTYASSPSLQRPVHWTRLVHVPAEGFLEDDVFGPPGLEGVYNYFQDLIKVVGGGAETSWLAGYPGMHMNMDPDADFGSQEEITATIDALKEKADAYKHQLTRWLQTRGVDVKMLAGKIAEFGENAKALVQLIAGTRGIPVRILIGSERGEQASTQDRENWNDIVKDCRTSYAHPILLRPFIDRLIEYNYLPKPAQWEPKWPEAGGMSETEKLGAAESMMKLNDHDQVVIKGNEVREFLGKEPLTPAEIEEIQEQKKALMPPPPEPPEEEEEEEEEDPDEEEEVGKLEAALRKSGGTLTLMVKEPE